MTHVRSADGTTIAYETTGDGPALILVGGAFNDRNARAAGTPLAAVLAPRFTVYSYDRRGRGGSGDTPPWDVAREVEDLAALVAEAGGSALAYGHSSGAVLALEAAARGVALTRLALYEPPLVLDASRRPTAALAAELDELCAAGRPGDAAERFLTGVVGVPAQAVAGMRRAPMWAGLEALAHTLSYDVRITDGGPALIERAASVRAPTVVLGGGASPPWMAHGLRALADALPAGTLRTLAGQTHDADPTVVAGALVEVFAGA